jgi:hypothetical protein
MDRRTARGLLTWIALLLVLTVVESSISPHTPAENHAGNHRSEADRPEAGQAEDKVAAYTLWLTIFTAMLGLSTIGLWVETGRTRRLARSEFISTHRPRLIVRQFQLDRPLHDDALKCRFSIINVGDTEGVVTLVTAQIALWNGSFWEAPGINPLIRPLKQPITMRNGVRISATATSVFNVTEDQIAGVQGGSLIVCAVGEITYTDALGTERRTGFRRNYNVSTDMFTASTNEDQEYQD